jgi:hypothetical protein
MNNGKFPVDPQLKLQGTLKSGENADVIVFSVHLALFEMVCIVTVPPDGETIAPVYVKFKISQRQKKPANGAQVLRRRARPAPGSVPENHEFDDQAQFEEQDA